MEGRDTKVRMGEGMEEEEEQKEENGIPSD